MFFFNLGGHEHEIGVRSLCEYLWSQFGKSHKVKFIAVDFSAVVSDILRHSSPGNMGVILKRMMLRAASLVADNLHINALVTGESMGQVASQTLANLHVIDQVTSKLMLRPLIAQDKEAIINIARKIGTENFSKVIPEYCGALSTNPDIAVAFEEIEMEENKLNLELVRQAVIAADVEDIRNINTQVPRSAISKGEDIDSSALILDIRDPEQVNSSPLKHVKNKVIALPFYRVESQFIKLDQTKHYLLYCDRGLMSQLQVALLTEKGFNNVSVYK
jgi:thiamine biosynthesis protein ThiI